MTIDPVTWSKLHGATTHFPIALLLVSTACEGVGLLPIGAERQRDFRFVATVTMILGALGSYGAVASGLLMTKGQAWGHGTMLRHHQFVWPAFALMTALAIWRGINWKKAAERPPTMYLALLFLAALLMSAAGYWGGEVLNHG